MRDAGGRVPGILDDHLRTLRLQAGPRPRTGPRRARSWALNPPADAVVRRIFDMALQGKSNLDITKSAQRRGHPHFQRKEVAQDHRPLHPHQRGLCRNRGLGNQLQGRPAARAGRGRTPRHRDQEGVPTRRQVDAVPRSEQGEPPPRLQPLSAQRAGQVRDLRQGHDRCRGQERQVHLLHLPLPPQAR